MTLTPEELMLTYFVLHFSTDRNEKGQWFARNLSTDEIEDGVSINGKIKGLPKNKDGMFTEPCEMEFSTTEKAFLLKSIDRPLPVEESEIKLALRAKLS